MTLKNKLSLYLDLGFTKNEANVLDYLFTIDSASIREIYQSTGISRTALYPLLTKLVNDNIVIESKDREKQIFSTVSPMILYSVLEQKSKDLKKISNNLDIFINNFHKTNSSERLHNVNYYNSGQIESLFNKIITKMSLQDYTLDVIWDPKKSNEQNPLKVFNDELTPLHDKNVRRLLPKSEFNLNYALWLNEQTETQTRFINNIDESNIESDTIITSESVIFLDYYDTEKLGVEIYNSSIRESMSFMFNSLWYNSIPLQ